MGSSTINAIWHSAADHSERNIWPDLTKPGFLTHPILQVWRFIAPTTSMPLISNFHLLFYEHMTCENSRSKAWCDVMLQLIEIYGLDMCGSLMLSNLVTYKSYECRDHSVLYTVVSQCIMHFVQHYTSASGYTTTTPNLTGGKTKYHLPRF